MSENERVILTVCGEENYNEKTHEIEPVNKIIVPYGMAEKYKKSPQWAMFADYIEEAPEPKYTLRERIRIKLRHIAWTIKSLFSKPTKEAEDVSWDDYDWDDEHIIELE